MKRKRESIDPKAKKERDVLVRFYSENEQLLLQAIKDFEIRIALKTEQLEMDKDVLEMLVDKLNSGKRSRASSKKR